MVDCKFKAFCFQLVYQSDKRTETYEGVEKY